MEESLEISNLAVLGKDDVGSVMHLVPKKYDNAPAPENVPASKNQ